MPNTPPPEVIPKPIGDPPPHQPEPEPKQEPEPKPIQDPHLTKADFEPLRMAIAGSEKWEVHTKDDPDPNPVIPKGQE